MNTKISLLLFARLFDRKNMFYNLKLGTDNYCIHIHYLQNINWLASGVSTNSEKE